MDRVVIYREELRKYLNTSSGDLWKYLDKKANIATAKAKIAVGVRTGALRDSINKRHLGNVTGQYIWIGSEKSYAYYHHEGTEPHIIRPREQGGVLVFRGSRGVVRTHMVKHPGTRANKYLSDQLHHFRF